VTKPNQPRRPGEDPSLFEEWMGMTESEWDALGQGDADAAQD
jgi:hypothetical protein